MSILVFFQNSTGTRVFRRMILKYLVTTSFLILTAHAEWQMPLLINKEQSKMRVDDGSVSYRLPNNSRPLHYDIFISTGIHIPEFEFQGVVGVRIVVLETSQQIVMNYKQLTISNIHLFDNNDLIIQTNVPFALLEAQELLVISPQMQLVQGQILRVQINYSGTLRTDDYGFFRSSYVHESGRRVWQATTQFQATDARHAFPW
jgi:aminopeptidase N